MRRVPRHPRRRPVLERADHSIGAAGLPKRGYARRAAPRGGAVPSQRGTGRVRATLSRGIDRRGVLIRTDVGRGRNTKSCGARPARTRRGARITRLGFTVPRDRRRCPSFDRGMTTERERHALEGDMRSSLGRSSDRSSATGRLPGDGNASAARLVGDTGLRYERDSPARGKKMRARRQTGFIGQAATTLRRMESAVRPARAGSRTRSID